MPWKDTNAMQERIQFISDWLTRIDTFSDLCARYDISRKSGYKWIDRYQKEGPDWVLDRSHAARVIANKTPLAVEQALMEMRALHPTWGARKLLHKVGLQQPALMLPHESTVCDMLKRNGLITAKPRRRAIGHPGRPSSVVSCPNDSWSVDFKGQFRLGDGSYCYPLTVTDNYSRYLRAVVGGHMRYYGVPRNAARLKMFRYRITQLWHRTLCRRSQVRPVRWPRMAKLAEHWLPSIRICHPYPNQRLIVTT